ncbi:MAG: hypothetical protein A3G32_03825 [Deltaproteobacteria bacterium RIFCSPLOWO2_12_FULL_40_28]|nr:MAG: hypothetical protein A3C45_05715 [Deltaproteobacteria bacterium RIFCSPHIGHO2_02_FULL_40_28]OGQ19450.1 MAG: hypothetical protein A3E27_06345 [Deltaproteobacteria bacterium RIFCSPHIGHO2_12_FULL_40_32]OGQ39894.1 MAG: hypothetical protein A3I69_07310 [Deltaproteobacteria bacterium RIFCSPLOWO2_02_FULL_40_36]OGQ53887.1 MAG: hypothetical protein A3G32_03825 [Deltaproteobacteria bacterium RIFCSPLOWO2_12_FULL_40_28]
MAKKDSTKKEDEKPKVDFEIGAKGLLGGFFKGLGSLIDLADKLDKTGGIEKSGEFGVKGQKDLTGVYGFSIRSMAGPGGVARPVVRPFGDISKFKSEVHPSQKAPPKGPVVEETTEPLTDLFDEGDYLRIVAELPGVNESEITCEVQGDDVIQITTKGKRKYSKEILLESKIDPQSLEKSYVNGVLELKLKKSVREK